MANNGEDQWREMTMKAKKLTDENDKWRRKPINTPMWSHSVPMTMRKENESLTQWRTNENEIMKLEVMTNEEVNDY